MGLALLFIIWLITLASSYFFFAKTWWMPDLASAEGAAIDHQFMLSYVAMGVVFLASQLGLGLFVWKYRDRSGAAQATYSHGHTGLEALWTSLTAVLFLGLNLMGYSVWAETKMRDPGPNAVQVEITGMQFNWYFRYPGPDGKFGRIKPELIDASQGNEAAVGMDPADPAGKDDIVSGVLMLPVDRQVGMTLRAQDVIHDFFVREMRIKQDAVPGLMVPMHYTPTKIGSYEAACAELCGLGHYKMRADVKVVPQQEFDAWIAAKVKEKQEE
jgi:cytochrome c oxidase subunit 2